MQHNFTFSYPIHLYITKIIPHINIHNNEFGKINTYNNLQLYPVFKIPRKIKALYTFPKAQYDINTYILFKQIFQNSVILFFATAHVKI